MLKYRHRAALSAALPALLIFNLQAQENKVSLEAVKVVSAAGYEQDIIDASASITVITAEELEGKAYFDVTDALRDVPGVSIEGGGTGSRGKGMGGNSISMRGMSSGYTLLLVDGKPQGNSGQVYYNGEGSGQEIAWLPPIASIERIEIIKGPMSSLYGTQALGGIINFITKKVSNDFRGTISAQSILQEDSDSGNEQQYNMSLTGPIIKDKLGFQLNGAFNKRDEDKIPAGNTAKDRTNLSGKLSWVIDQNNDLFINYGYMRQEVDGTVDGVGTDTEKEDQKQEYGIAHDLSWGDMITTKTYIQKEDMENKFQNEGTEYEQLIANSKTVIPFETNKMTLGVEYREEDTNHGTRGKNITDISRWQLALFIEDEYFFTDNFFLTSGIRYNEDEKYGGEIVPRAYAIYKIGDSFTIKGGVSSGYLTPNLKQGDSAWVEGGFGGSTDGADIGNNDLKPEESLSYELGFIYNDGENFDISLTAYQTDFKNKIQKSTICDRRQSSTTGDIECIYLGYNYEAIAQYNNADEAELQGVEASIAYKLTTFDMYANYTYAQSEVTKGSNIGDPLNNTPKHMFNLGFNYKVTPDLKLWSKGRYRGKTLSTDSQIPAYTIADLGANYSISKNLLFSFGIYNFLDKDINNDTYSKILDGRKYALGLTYDF